MPSTYPLTIYRGDTHRWQFRLWADAAKTSPVDLTEATATSEIRSHSGTLVTALACAIALPNIIDVELSAAASKTLTTTPSHWDLQLLWTNGDVQTPVGGAVTLQLDATV
ncbi:MAG TPA: hypothetical protein VNM36_08950 [Gemmatimonadaceae bacterium]|nr:hypothetical protein [Gemmatimonadaceae bacterium]